MKGNKKLLVVAILLLLIAVSYGTYAIYKTAVSGDATVTAAKWAVEFKDGSDTLTDSFNVTFSGAECTNPHVATGVIAPGAKCTKEITLDVTGTEVDVLYTAEADSENITVDGNLNPGNAFTAGIEDADGVILMSDTQEETFKVTLEWGGEEGTPYDAADTAIGIAQSEITVPIKLVAKQMIGS